MAEIWKYSHTITVGCKKSKEIKYYYSSEGRLKRVWYNGKIEYYTPKKTGNKERIYVTIAKLFPEICGEYFKGCQIDHINCDRTDNRAINLRCCTGSENMLNPLTRQHCSEAAKKRWKDGVYNNRVKSLKGKSLSEEHKRKISEGNKGKTRSEETKQIMREAAKHRPPISEETKKKMSEAQLKNPTKYWLEKHLPKEMKEKIITKLKGRIKINNGRECKCIHPKELQSYIDKGWVKGILKKNKTMNVFED